ncbi:hypothetical protein NBRC110019_13420 [Neptunitalea chrysea]|uniref:Probable endolytic peptidoglycan transglycosylase RlpA n=1 Tax=Neptunitalea chrysea TaxID=1647581 RepID=A0A9W6B7R8_9FLAO|nr:septal ring lytic transglycosylase RlpA family protein [Neptunitalea chrysea]GLB52303.1 hypothetical protein NBRC110019_13420 [Neptunitalea chrysea]
MRNIYFLLFLFITLGVSAQVETGEASFYAKKFNGRTTASGEIYHHILPTAAHRTLPFGTKVKVTNLANNRWAIVKINDRGPFVKGRIIDVSRSVAEKLDFINAGITKVKIEVIGEEDVEVAETVLSNDDVKTTTTTTKVETVPVSTNTVSEVVITTVATTTAPTVPGNEYYELGVEQVSPDWMGVQIGSFQELTNLIRLVDGLKSKYKKKVVVQVKNRNGLKVYALIIGKFLTRDKAENFKERVRKDYPDSFIVDLRK